MDNLENKILLVLDLDETLIHSSETAIASIAFDFTCGDFFVYKRQGLDQFINSIKEDFRIAVWSSASDEYVASITSTLFPGNYRLEFIWGRSKCTLKRDLERNEYFYTKPLKKLKNKGFQLEKVLIVDDSPEKGKGNFGNTIYIAEFKGAPDDELIKLAAYLQKLKSVGNVRTIEKRGWHLNG